MHLTQKHVYYTLSNGNRQVLFENFFAKPQITRISQIFPPASLKSQASSLRMDADDVKKNGRTKREENLIFRFWFFVLSLLPPRSPKSPVQISMAGAFYWCGTLAFAGLCR